MTNKRAVQAFLATSALFLAMAGMNARAQEASAPAAQAPATTQAPQTTAPAARPGRHGGLRAIDTNGDGQISRDEAKGHAWLEKNFDQIDTNHDGQLSKEELAAWRKAHKGEMRGEARAKRAEHFDAKFKAADKNGDGALTKDEVQAGMPHLAKQFDQIDANHDGKITEDEIRAYMKARHDARKAQKGASAPAAPSTTQTQ